MKIYNNFTGGAMNKDLELRVFPKSFYLDAKNIRILSPDGQNSRSVKFPLGNTVKTALSLGTNAECIGSCVDTFRNKIYWAVVSDSGSYVCEFDVATETENIVLSDTRADINNIFGFVSGGYVEMRVLNDNDNGKNFLVLTDGENEPKFFNIASAKVLIDSYFVLEDISLIKNAPTAAPALTLGNTASGNENNLESKFLSFAYRYEYQNGELSALSPFSDFAFFPEKFSYDYKSGTNKGMFNNFSKVDIDINTGSTNVKEIQLIVKESGSNTAYIVDSYKKATQSPEWGNGTTETVTFDNSRIYRALEANQLTRAYDNVPTKAATLELIGNRIVFGNYTEGYDLTYNGADSNLAFTLDYVSAAGTAGQAHKQVKSNRDYEIALAYGDGKGRFTTPIVSAGNTTFVPYTVADEKVQLRLTIDNNSRPPEWATEYRLFMKQSRTNYDVIAPITFYREGVMAWIRIEGSDRDKIKEGDFIYVKSDTSGLKNTTIRTKVLEVTDQDRNFLKTGDDITGVTTFQPSGVYFRVEVSDYSLSEAAVTSFAAGTVFAFRSASTSNNILGSVSYVEDIYYKNTNLDDLTDNNTYTGSDDIRYEIQVDGIAGTNTFQWREVNVSTGVTGAYTTLVAMTGAAQTLSNGLTITWGATTGHTLNDEWVISCKGAARTSDWNEGGSVGGDGRKAIMIFAAKNVASEGDEGVKAGATILLTYDDSASGSNVETLSGLVSESLTSSADYPNLEEWFYGDNIISQLTYPADTTSIMFRRGSLVKTDGQQMTVSASGDMFMMMLSQASYTGSGGSEIRIDTSFQITEFDNNIIFETIPVDETTDIFYELPNSYPVSSNRHEGDTNQVFGVTDAVITLDYFNSFGWYNGFESYKIGDTFNENTMVLDTKPLVPIENYQEITRIASLTYGGTYEATTQFNSLNEFNLSEINYKDLDGKYGAIAKLHSADTNLLAFQHDKTHRILFSKSILFNGDGSGNVTQSSNVLGQEVAYTGEYGICNNPESFAFFGNRIYHLDKDRGALMRLSADGYTEISKEGMSDYFRTLTVQASYVGGYDAYNDEYLINVGDTLAFQEGNGFAAFYEYSPERMLSVNNRLYSIKAGQIWLHDDNTTRNNFYGVQTDAYIETVFADIPQDIKHYKSVNLESDVTWDATITTNFGISTLVEAEWSLEEGEYYAYIRQLESSTVADFTVDSTVGGVGEVATIVSLTVGTGLPLPRAMAIGDTVWKDNGNDTVTTIGTITAIDRAANTITLSSVAGLSVSDLIMYRKNNRVEGAAMKGYYMKLALTSSNSTNKELFAVKVEAVRSFD